MNFVKKPRKRMRLDVENNFESNDDLWGPEEIDITAEEFDMLEVQATQGTSASSSHVPHTRPSVNNNNNSFQIDFAKQKQYELEGKVKILSDTVDTLKKEVLEEKQKKDKIVAEKAHEFEQKEKLLRKEIEKLLSSLQFKEQEMKIIHEKAKSLEIQMKEDNANKKASTSKSPNKFLEKFNFKANDSVHTSEVKKLHKGAPNRKYTLDLDSKEGETTDCDVISSMLCNRLTPFHQTQIDTDNTPAVVQVSPISVTNISLEHKTDVIFHQYSSILENYINCAIQNIADLTNTNSISSLLFKKKYYSQERTVVISCLKDLTYTISCSQSKDFISSLNSQSRLLEEIKKASQCKDSSDTPSTSTSSDCDKKHGQYEKKTYSLLESLFILAIPETYPSGFTCNEEIEWSLSALASWSVTNPKSFVNSFNDRIIISHVINCFNFTATGIVLRMLTDICTLNEYLPKLIHNSDACHLCGIAMLLTRTISNSPVECINLMIMVEDYLSSVLTVHTFIDMKLENVPCILMVLQAVLSLLLKFYSIRKNQDVTILLKKGFTLVHYLSKYIPSFKQRRVDSEDLYISTVCTMLSLSKEDASFKDFYEIAHELWDFQDESGEFEQEDLSDDSTPAMNLQSQSENETHI